MDWNKQTQDMLKSWAEAQQKMWDGWLNGLQGTGKSAASDAWLKTIETWQRSVNDTFEAQAKLSQVWLDNLKAAQPKPENAANWAKQTEEMLKKMTELQRQLWDSCFATLKKADLRKMPGPWEQEATQLFQNWQDTARKTMEAQAALISSWTKR